MSRLALLVLLVTSAAQADTATLHSLEWLVVSNDYVAHGEVISRKPVRGRPGDFVLTLKNIGPPLKGNKGDLFAAVVQGPQPAVGQEVVVFTRRRFSPSSCGRDPQTGKLSGSWEQVVTRVLDGSHGWTAPTRDFQQVHSLEAMLERIRAAASEPRTMHSVRVPVPRDTPLGRVLGDVLGDTGLVLPRDAATERYVLTLLASREASDRVLGTQLLRDFESVANIKRLLALRDDPTTVLRNGTPHPWVRESAELTLTAWGVPFEPR